MHVSSIATGAAASGAYPSGRSPEPVEDQASSTIPVAPTEPSVSGAVKVSLSADALAYLSATKSSPLANAKTAYHQQYFPGREGFDTSALAKAVADPGHQSSSAGKTLSEAAIHARSDMDEKYARMKGSGEPFNPDSFEGRDWYTVMGELDRRSLLAIREDVGGLFNSKEQAQAEFIMQQQQGMAMGFAAGPNSQSSKWHDPFGDDWTARYKAAGAFLDAVSLDEKQTGEWMLRRAGVATGLQRSLKESEEPEFKFMSLIDMLNESDRERAEQERLRDDELPPEPSDTKRDLWMEQAVRAYAEIGEV